MHHSIDNRPLRFPWLLTFFADFAAVAAAYVTTFFLRFHSKFGESLFGAVPVLFGSRPGEPGETLQAFYIASALRLIIIITAVLCTLYALRNLYEGRRHLIKRPIAWDIIVANAAALAIFYSYWYLKRNVYHPRSFFASVLIFNAFFCIMFRYAAAAFLTWLRSRFGIDTCRTLLAGSGEQIEFIAALIEIQHPHGVQLAEHMPFIAGSPFDVQLERIRQAIQRQRPDLLIGDCSAFSVPEIMQLLELTQNEQIPVKILSPEFSVLVTHARLPCDRIHGIPLVHFDAPARRGHLGILRRTLTFLFASLFLTVLAPLLLLIALLIRLTSRGPAIFVQERIGINRMPFQLYKFRTMYNQAEELLAQMEEFNESEGALFKIKKDPRITPFGHFLRRFSLDELPQLLNVIKGDMVLVGPRPLPRRDFKNYYEQWHYSRHGGLPGLTCLWQISGRSNISFHNMCILDVYYLRNHNWILDFKIALKTVRVVIFGEGAY